MELVEGTHVVKLRVFNEAGIADETTTTVHVRESLEGSWSGAFTLPPGDERPAQLRLDLEQDGETLTGTVSYCLFGEEIELPIVEGTATYSTLRIRAEGNSPPPAILHRIILEGSPEEHLSGEAQILDAAVGSTMNRSWIALRQ